MMLLSSPLPTECDRLYPERSDDYLHASPYHVAASTNGTTRWSKLRVVLGAGLVVAALALALFTVHQRVLFAPQSLSLSSVAATADEPLEDLADGGAISAVDGRAALRDSLFQAFGLSPPSQEEPDADALIVSPAADTLAAAARASSLPSSTAEKKKKWNWLSPSGPSFSEMKEQDAEFVTVSGVYKHMLEKRHTQVAEAVSELLHAEMNYNLTITCFNKAILQMQKFALTQSEFSNLIDWMDVNCGNKPLETSDTNTNLNGPSDIIFEDQNKGGEERIFMSKDEFQARIAKHFDPVLESYKTPLKSVEGEKFQTTQKIRLLQQCLDAATELATDRDSGLVLTSRLPTTLRWTLESCMKD